MKHILHNISILKESKSNPDEEYITLRFFNTDTKREEYTHVTIGNFNNAWWSDIMVKDRYGIYTFENLRYKHKRLGLINADSKPTLIEETSQKEALEIIDLIKNA